jgi:hypothetical protein
MSTQQSFSQAPRKRPTAEVVYIAPDDLSPGLISSDESLLWPVKLLDQNQAYFPTTEVPFLDGSESITEDGSESVGWRNAGWSEEEENVASTFLLWLCIILITL